MINGLVYYRQYVWSPGASLCSVEDKATTASEWHEPAGSNVVCVQAASEIDGPLPSVLLLLLLASVHGCRRRPTMPSWAQSSVTARICHAPRRRRTLWQRLQRCASHGEQGGRLVTRKLHHRLRPGRAQHGHRLNIAAVEPVVRLPASTCTTPC